MQRTTGKSLNRFAFGRNWLNFIVDVDESRVQAAEQSLCSMLGLADLCGRSFLDVGCGSGLSSLAAARLGAAPIRSFDFDPESVSATTALRERYAAESNWTIERGDATDATYMRTLGTFDIVYAWGVLHHTGALWQAMENAVARVAPGGLFFVAVYNDQGRRSRRWQKVKRRYNRLPALLQAPYAVAVMAPTEARALVGAAARHQLGSYVSSWTKGYDRGMSRWHDLLDWVGGYPFEVATPEETFRFCRERGFELRELSTSGGGLGCNQFVFRRTA